MTDDFASQEKYINESLDNIKSRLTKVEGTLQEHAVSEVKMEARIMASIGQSEARIMSHVTTKTQGYDRLEAKFYAYSGMLSIVLASGIGAAFKYLLD